MKRSACLLLGALLLSGCARQEGPRQAPEGSTPVQPRAIGGAETVLPLPAPAALQRAETALRDRGFAITPLSGAGRPLEATSTGSTSPAWADCPTIRVRDEFSEAFRSRRVDVSDGATRVTVTIAPVSANETRLVFRTLNIGTYINSFTNTPQESSCRSTGVLERELIAAVSAGT